MTGMTSLTDHASAHRVSRAEFEQFRDARELDGGRYELLAGEVLVTPSPSVQRQRVVSRLLVLLSPLLDHGHEVLPAPLDLPLGDGDTTSVLQPDLVVVPRQTAGTGEVEGLPLLVVEVLSPTTWRRDLGVKRDAYAEAGVRHYWVVSPTEPSLTVYELGPKGYREVCHVTRDGKAALTAPWDLTIRPSDLVR